MTEILIPGHPKTKAFVTHGGANGIYDAITHGVPMVGIPLFGEQRDNIAHMKAKGAAVGLEFTTMSTTDLVNALKTVINNPLWVWYNYCTEYHANCDERPECHNESKYEPIYE